MIPIFQRGSRACGQTANKWGSQTSRPESRSATISGDSCPNSSPQGLWGFLDSTLRAPTGQGDRRQHGPGWLKSLLRHDSPSPTYRLCTF